MTVAVQSRLAAAEAAIDADISRAAAWQRLDRLPESVESTPEPFPVAALGPVLGAAVQAIAVDVQAPDSLVGGAVLRGHTAQLTRTQTPTRRHSTAALLSCCHAPRRFGRVAMGTS